MQRQKESLKRNIPNQENYGCQLSIGYLELSAMASFSLPQNLSG